MLDPRRIYLTTGFGQGFFFASWAVAAVVWWAVVLDLSPLQLVLLGTALEGTVLFSEIPTGVVADVLSRKWSVVTSWLVIGTAQFLTPLSEHFVWLMLCQVLWGLGLTFQSGADTAWVTDEIREPDDGLIVRHAMWRAVGVIAGILAAFVILTGSITLVMQVAGVGSVLFGCWLAVTMRETNFTPASGDARATWRAFGATLKKGFELTRRVSALRLMVVAVVFLAAADELVDRLDVDRVVDLGFPDLSGEDSVVLFGIVWMVMTILTIPVMAAANRHAERMEQPGGDGSARLLRLLIIAGATGVLFLAIGTPLALALMGWVMRDVIRETVEPLSMAWTNRHAEPDVRATVLSFRSQAQSGGEVLGGVLLGLVAQFLGGGVAFGAAAILMLIAAFQFRASRDL